MSAQQWRSQKFQLGASSLPSFSLLLLTPLRVLPSSPPLPCLRSRNPENPAIYIGGLDERRVLPQRGLGRSPSRNRIRCILACLVAINDFNYFKMTKLANFVQFKRKLMFCLEDWGLGPHWLRHCGPCTDMLCGRLPNLPGHCTRPTQRHMGGPEL